MKKDVIDKIDIYKIKKSEELLKYYKDWTGNNKYNKDMVEWNYTAPQTTVSIVKQYVLNKNSLDFGCGGGFVAYAISFVSKSSTGIDINEKAVIYAKKRFNRVNFFCKNFSDLLKSQEKYDFVHSSEVIEHVSDINLYMQVLKQLVKKKGYLYITTPDLGHPKVPEDITKWDVLCPPIHVQHFTKKTVSVLFKKYGFNIIKFYKNRKPGLIFLSQKS